MGHQKVDVAKMFTAATQMSGAEAEITKLQAEVGRLRALQAPELEAQLEVLREQLKMQTGVQSIILADIKPNPGQPRKTFSIQSIDGMARSLLKDGQLHPIIVIPALDGEGYDLLDGERRWRAAQQLGWQNLKAVSMPRPKDLHRKALLTTLYREDLNPLDKAEAILTEISLQTGTDASLSQRILSTVVRRLDYQKRMKQIGELVTASDEAQKQGLETLELSDLERSILQVLLGLGLNPASVCANDFRMLSLYPDLQLAIRELSLKASQAMVLQRLSAKKLGESEQKAAQLRVGATQEVVKKELTLTETRELVNQIVEKHASKLVLSNKNKQAKTIMSTLKKLSFAGIERSTLEDFQKSLQQKLQEVEAVLQTEK